MYRLIITVFTSFMLLTSSAQAQVKKSKKATNKNSVHKKVTKGKTKKNTSVYYGVASYYADKFRGRTTADGSSYRHRINSAACNVLPLGTWIRVTNLKNNKSIVVKVNDRLHSRSNRIVDLSKSAAQQLGYVKSGVTRVRVDVLGKKQP